MAKERRGIEAARKAVDAFREHMGYTVNDLEPESLMSDLVADLMHLAESQEIGGEWLVERAEVKWAEETDDPEYINLEDVGQVEPDPEVGGAPLPAGVGADHDALRSGADELAYNPDGPYSPQFNPARHPQW